MLQALASAGIRPDFLVGTSAGAINAAWLAGRGPAADLDELERTWLRLRREVIFPVSPRGSLTAILGRRNHLIESRGLAELLRRELGYRRLEDAVVPVHVVAMNLLTGRGVLISNCDTVEALLASTALPGIYPPVESASGHLVDGGVGSNTPISHAVDLGADGVYVLPSGYACALESPPTTPLGVALHALTLSLQRQLISDVERYSPFVDVQVVPPLCPLDVSPVDFSRSRELIARARRSTERWLSRPARQAGGADQLALHEHHRNKQEETWKPKRVSLPSRS
jgi:NTE family protein